MVMTDWRSGKRRQYSVTFKRQILAESAESDVSVASVARRHGLNANLIFNWRRRFGAALGPAFVPAVIVPEDAGPAALPSDGPGHDRHLAGHSPGASMELVCLGGRRIILGPDFDAPALGRLLAVVDR